MRRVILVAILGSLFAASLAYALSGKPYISSRDVDFVGLVPPPPAEDSPAGKRDLQAVLDSQKNLAPDRINLVRTEDAELNMYRIAGGVLGPTFKKDLFPLATAFFAKINEEKAIGVDGVKHKYKRPRPFQYNKAVQDFGHERVAHVHAATAHEMPEPDAKEAVSPTYPSGHCTFGTEAILLLTMIVPEKREALFARRWEYDNNRIASGSTYPSDCEAGHIIATLTVEQMMKNPEFRADYDAVKSEIRKGLNLP